MGEAQFGNVSDELLRELAVIEELAVLVQPPGAQVDLVHGHGLMEPIMVLAGFHPGSVAPFEAVFGNDDGCGIRAQFEALAIRIGLQ